MFQVFFIALIALFVVTIHATDFLKRQDFQSQLHNSKSSILNFQKPKSYNTTSSRLRGVVNVHFVPHTHDDVGWLKTVDEYFYGSRNDIQRATVQNILNAVIKELQFNPDRRFIYVEQAFFQRWYSEQSSQTQSVVKGLVARGQLEMINGGWCMHDEAAPGFADMIDNTALGHRWLLQEFNVTPRTTWQIDPFGHSGFQASMLSSPIAGYNAVYFARDDWQEQHQREVNKTTEMIWAPSNSLGMNGATFAGVLYGGYCTIGGISMDIYSNDAPLMDDPTLEDINVAAVIDGVVSAAADAVSKYPNGEPGGDGTKDVLLPLGCDFNYENAATWFTNTDKLIHWLNQDGRVNAFYSTPSIYTDAKLETGKSYTIKANDDFMNYADGKHNYWSGYFTSRAALKGYTRDTSSIFSTVRQMQVFAGLPPVDMGPSNPLYRLERAMGVSQHHDAVSGTSKQHVANDYAKRQAWGREDADVLISSALEKLTGYSSAPFVGCDLANVTICPALELGKPTAVLIWNQQATTTVQKNVILPVGFPSGVTSYSVTDNKGNLVLAQILPLSSRDLSIRTTYYNVSNTANVQWLAFQTSAPISPAGYAIYFITPTSENEAPLTVKSTLRFVQVDSFKTASTDSTLTNGRITLTFDGSSGLVRQWSDSVSGINEAFGQTFLWYNSSVGNRDDGQASGAYIFRPNSSTPFPVTDGPVTVSFINGPIINEARQVFQDWATQTIRLWKGALSADFNFEIGPIPHADGLGKEIISKFTTDLNTDSTWITDSNGRDSMTRKFNSRPTWNLTVYEPAAGNYYPVNAFIATTDIITGHTISVNTDRSQGGASLADGSVELMVHRRLQADDGRGVGEPLNETGIDGNGLIIRATHRVSFDISNAAASISRRTALADLMWRDNYRYAALVNGITPSSFITAYNVSFSGISSALPNNVHLLTLHAQGPSSILIRVSHSYEVTEDSTMAAPASVSLKALFARSKLQLSSCTEMTLSGNQPLATAPKITYNVTGQGSTTLPVIPSFDPIQFAFTINAMEIRTFMCTCSYTS